MKYMQKCSRNFTTNQKIFPILGKKFQTKGQRSSKANFIQEIRWAALEQEIYELSGRLWDKNVCSYRKYTPC